MKADFTELNRHRVRTGRMGSDDSEGRNGMFVFRTGKIDLICICSDGYGDVCDWEHVSARARGLDLKERVPTWEEMCMLKDLFFEPEECVVQFHPPHSEYVNCHKHVLHLWRHKHVEIPRPPPELVGPVTGR